MTCMETIGQYAFRSLGYGEKLLPRTDFTLCQQFTLIGSGLIWNLYFGALALLFGFFLSNALAMAKASPRRWRWCCPSTWHGATRRCGPTPWNPMTAGKTDRRAPMNEPRPSHSELREQAGAAIAQAKAVPDAGARHQARDWPPRGRGGAGRAVFLVSVMGTQNSSSAGHHGCPAQRDAQCTNRPRGGLHRRAGCLIRRSADR